MGSKFDARLKCGRKILIPYIFMSQIKKIYPLTSDHSLPLKIFKLNARKNPSFHAMQGVVFEWRRKVRKPKERYINDFLKNM